MFLPARTPGAWAIWAGNCVFAETAIALREAFTLIGMPGVDVYEGVGFGNAPWAERSVDDMGTDRLEFDTKHVYAARRNIILRSLAAAIQVWDFAASHVEYWRSAGLAFSFLPLSVPACWLATNVEPASWQGVDVLFYGARNDRREAIKNRLVAELAPFKVAFYLDFDLFGAERDRVIQETKLLLNIHYYKAATLVVHRINYLMAKGKCVLSEPRLQTYTSTPAMQAPSSSLRSKSLLARRSPCFVMISVVESQSLIRESWLRLSKPKLIHGSVQPLPLVSSLATDRCCCQNFPVAAWDDDDDQASPRLAGKAM